MNLYLVEDTMLDTHRLLVRAASVDEANALADAEIGHTAADVFRAVTLIATEGPAAVVWQAVECVPDHDPFRDPG
jgi:hypothetical protein